MKIRNILEGLNEARKRIMDKQDKKTINRALDKLTKNTHFRNVPFDEIDDILREEGYLALDNDGSEFEGFFTGDDGKATLDIGIIETESDRGIFDKVENVMLVVTWHKIDNLYEIVAYVS